MSMTITLHQPDGTTKTFTQTFVSGRMLRRTAEYEKMFADEIKKAKETGEYDSLKDMDMAAEYVSEAFNGQFTREEYIDGIESHKLISEFIRIKTEVQTGRSEALGVTADPNG